ncbi:hypothetical protein D3C76_928410 [compost metagenome]
MAADSPFDGAPPCLLLWLDLDQFRDKGQRQIFKPKRLRQLTAKRMECTAQVRTGPPLHLRALLLQSLQLFVQILFVDTGLESQLARAISLLGQRIEPLADLRLVSHQRRRRQLAREPETLSQTAILVSLLLATITQLAPVRDTLPKLINTGTAHLQITLALLVDPTFLSINAALTVLTFGFRELAFGIQPLGLGQPQTITLLGKPDGKNDL